MQKVSPHKVEMMKEFSDPKYKVDVLKVEVPVNELCRMAIPPVNLFTAKKEDCHLL